LEEKEKWKEIGLVQKYITVLNSLLFIAFRDGTVSSFEIHAASHLEETIQAQLWATWKIDECRDCWRWLSVIFFYEKWSTFSFPSVTLSLKEGTAAYSCLKEGINMIIPQGK
jgi:hypothetical protein